MLVTDKSLALNETVRQMGFASVEDFALEKTKETLVEEIAETMRKTEIFQNKYQLDYIDFRKQFNSLPQPVFEKKKTAPKGLLIQTNRTFASKTLTT